MSVYLKDPKAICLGEMGLDFNRNFSSKEEQILCFESQLSLANSISKPLFLHQRDAHEEFLSVLDNHKFNQKLNQQNSYLKVVKQLKVLLTLLIP